MILIFDIGRTNKKFILFDKDYKVVEEKIETIPDMKDEDGDTCEDIGAITTWMKECVSYTLNKNYDIRAINFSTHGASMVHLNKEGEPVAPLYDYLKPVTPSLHTDFYGLFGGEKTFSLETGSPALDMLNSGIQLFWLENYKPDIFKKIHTSLHLPQYANYVFSGKTHTDITSIGCHTGLWDFRKGQYHSWLIKEGLTHLLPPPENTKSFDEIAIGKNKIPVGIGLHDSTAALLPFIYTAKEPFVLLSSGTWNISLNPYYEGELQPSDYEKDCLYFLSDINKKIAASRLFLGNEYQYQVKLLEKWYNKSDRYHLSVLPNEDIFLKVINKQSPATFFYPATMKGSGPIPGITERSPDLSNFDSFEEAYHKLMLDLTFLQKISLELISSGVKRLYISGGFTKSLVFMELLQNILPDWKIFITENPRASALGAAIAIHDAWQQEPLSENVSPVVPFNSRLKLDLSNYKFYIQPK